MKVLYILHSTIMGGATISFLNMVSELGKYGIQPYIVCPPHPNDIFLKEIDLRNLQYEEVPLMPLIVSKKENGFLFYYYRWKSLIYSILRIKKIIEQQRPAIIHSNTGVIHEGFWASRLAKKPHVWHIREYQDLDFEWKVLPTKKLFSFMLRNSWSICITEDINRHFGLKDENKSRCIYNGILNEKQITYCKDKQNYFLCASRVSEEKGIDDVIRAFALFYQSHPDFLLKIMGFGSKSYLDSLEKLAASLGCKDAVHFLGFQPLDIVTKYMQNAKALIVGSRFEGFGRMTAEAVMSGCCVIGRNTGGTKEIIEQTGGFLFETIHELFFQMQTLVDLSDIEYNDLINKAQHKARLLFTIENSGISIYDFYRKIVAS